MVASWQVPTMRYDRVKTQCDVEVVMRDGVKLFADVYSPETDDKLPVLLLRTPYDKSTAQTCVYLDTMWYARYGYIVVVQDCRGRYRSEGEFYPYKYETADSEDSIKWAACLPGANGEVAMYGFSYPGSIQLLAASTKTPQLKTIMPAMTGCNFYEPWTYEGGAMTQGFIQSWTLSLARDTALRAGDLAGMKRILGLLGQYSSMAYATPLNVLFEEFKKYVPYYFDWVEHDTYDDFWKTIAVQERYDDISLPVLHVGGWYDIFISGTIKNYIALRELQKNDPNRGRQKLLIGPWHHVPWQPKVGCINFGDEAENIVDLVQLKWLEQHMRTQASADSMPDSGLAPDLDPDVSIFILGANRWAHFDNWPPSNARELHLYLHSGGRANATAGDGSLNTEPAEKEAWDSFIYDSTFPVPSRGGHGCCFEDILPMGACDQSANQMRNDVLVYTTLPLSTDLTIAGAVSVLLYVSSSAVDADFTATLSELDENGRAVNLCNGIARASRCAVPKNDYAKKQESAEGKKLLLASERFKTRDEKIILQEDEIYAIEIHLGWIAAMVKQGRRIRLDISSSNFPHYERNTSTGNRFADLNEFKSARQTIFHDKDHPSALYMHVLD